MGGATIALRRADAGDLEYVERLLAANGLPAVDVQSAAGRFFVGIEGDEPIGVGGIEPHGTDGLLRSVVVEASVRGDGVGAALCAALERVAREMGIETLYLLTTSARGFFAGQGYQEIDRADVPVAIRETAQFAELCPASAACLHKAL